MNGTRSLRFSLSTVHARYETLEEIAYLVIPAVSNYGDSIISAEGGEGPEFVPAETLKIHCEQRNGRPVTLDHPRINGQPKWAYSSKDVAESYVIGKWMNVSYVNNRVEGELWVNVDKCKSLLGGKEIIETVEAGDTLEVSEGSFVIVDETPGKFGGMDYLATWLIIIVDHIAILPIGLRGACGVDSHGCGASLANRSKPKPRNQEIRVSVSSQLRPKGVRMANIFTRFFKGFIDPGEGPRGGSERVAVWSSELGDALAKALYAAEPGFDYIADNDAVNKTVIYCVKIYFGDSWSKPPLSIMYRRSFTMTDDNVSTLTLNDDAVEVEYTQIWAVKEVPTAVAYVGEVREGQVTQTHPITAEQIASGFMRVGCECESGQEESNVTVNSVDNNVTTNESEEVSMANENQVTPPATTLAPAAPVEPVAPVQAAAAPVTAPSPPTLATAGTPPVVNPPTVPGADPVEAWLDATNAPPEARSAIRAMSAQANAHKNELIGRIRAANGARWPAEDLEGLTIPVLTRIAQAEGVIFSGGYDYSQSRSVGSPDGLTAEVRQASKMPDVFAGIVRAKGNGNSASN